VLADPPIGITLNWLVKGFSSTDLKTGLSRDFKMTMRKAMSALLNCSLAYLADPTLSSGLNG
jgi:hypothetical protein